jgi:hypothetical protein
MQKRISPTLRAARNAVSISALRFGALGHQSRVKESMPDLEAQPMCCSATVRDAEE